MNISFVIPVFNGETTIIATIESILSQLSVGDEIIVINDGSTDRTLDILSELNSDKIKIINQVNKGVSYSRNIGAKEAKCDILAFFDSDDILFDNIVNLVKEAYSQRIDINWCFGYYKISSDNCSTVVRNRKISKGVYNSVFELYESFDNRVKHELLSTCALFFRRSAFVENNGFDESMISGEDTYMWLQFGLNNPKIYYLNSLAFIYKRGSRKEEIEVHKTRSKKEPERIFKAINLIKNHSEKNNYVLNVVSVWIYRHVKFTFKNFNITHLISLFLLNLLLLKVRFSKWI